ncbi:hypothetical protein EZV62_015142 [Acer yangbiense]|uniref:Uncharacterized protein n=1 Tax=Acer yangbiense TaxID=1000413 RepID=A0A5C7HUV3_9ROSI|nr:hypothetical protein EZV62_015142 [Acer yangbiense]
MEKPRGSPRKMKTNLCIPRLIKAGNNGRNKNKNLTPVTLLERFREAVFRLIMLSALSKATNDHHHHTVGSSRVSRSYYSPADPHHSEAVADCIEFIKKKAVADDNENGRDSSASTSIDDSTELIIPVPVM